MLKQCVKQQDVYFSKRKYVLYNVLERIVRGGHVIRSREGSPRLPRPRSEEIPLEDMASKACIYDNESDSYCFLSL